MIAISCVATLPRTAGSNEWTSSCSVVVRAVAQGYGAHLFSGAGGIKSFQRRHQRTLCAGIGGPPAK